MKRLMMTVAALGLLTTAAQAATTLYKRGAWETYITRATDNRPMCGMKVEGRGTMLTIKYSGDQIFLQMYKMGWSIPAETEIPGWLQFDNSQRFPMIGTGYMHRSGAGYVEFTVKQGTEVEFLSLFGDADKMVLGFDQGTQVPFTVNMNGSRGAAQSFKGCVVAIDTPEPQPFAKPAPQLPQPFGKPPVQPTTKKDDGSV